MGKRILIAEDDPNISKLVSLYLANDGYETKISADGEATLKLFRNENFDLVVLDIMMPGRDGWEVLETIRGTSKIPVIIMTARDFVGDKLKGFGLGADDYIVKPFEPMELVARVRARLKDTLTGKDAQKEPIRVGNMVVDLRKFEVTIDGKLLQLKPKEIKMLHYMLLNRGTVLGRNDMLENVWGFEFVGETRTVDMHIKRLRENLANANAPVTISTVWGVGYKLEVK